MLGFSEISIPHDREFGDRFIRFVSIFGTQFQIGGHIFSEIGYILLEHKTFLPVVVVPVFDHYVAPRFSHQNRFGIKSQAAVIVAARSLGSVLTFVVIV